MMLHFGYYASLQSVPLLGYALLSVLVQNSDSSLPGSYRTAQFVLRDCGVSLGSLLPLSKYPLRFRSSNLGIL